MLSAWHSYGIPQLPINNQPDQCKAKVMSWKRGDKYKKDKWSRCCLTR